MCSLLNLTPIVLLPKQKWIRFQEWWLQQLLMQVTSSKCSLIKQTVVQTKSPRHVQTLDIMAGWHGHLRSSCLSCMQSSYKIQLALQSHTISKFMILLGQIYSLPRVQVEHTWITPAPGSAWVLSLSKQHRSLFLFLSFHKEYGVLTAWF